MRGAIAGYSETISFKLWAQSNGIVSDYPGRAATLGTGGTPV